ncbi:MAG TPA: hypothetical protein VGL46_25855 [Pseudonocardiaceae bacterium]
MESSRSGGEEYDNVAPHINWIAKAAMPDFSWIGKAVMPDFSHLTKGWAVAAMPDYSDRFAQLAGAAIPNFSWQFDEITRIAMPDYSGQFKQLANVLTANFSWQFDQITKITMPDLSRQAELFEQIARQSASLTLTAAGVDKLSQAAAMTILVDAVPTDVSKDESWRRAANAWVATHGLAMFLWLAVCVIVVMFCVTSATDPDLIDQVNRVFATPGVIVGIGLAFWFGRKK